jgi:hypothetical protein
MMLLFALLIWISLPQGQSVTPPLVEQVLAYVEGERPLEVFLDTVYPTRVHDFVLLDIDQDDVPEVVLLAEPHFRQTPTIVFYTVDPETGPRRIREGLAPGPLVAVSGRYEDTHTHRIGMDMTVEGGGPADPKALARLSNSLDMHLVYYDGFYHADMRSEPGFIDMSYRQLPVPDNTCGGFEFTAPEAIGAGSLRGHDATQYLVVLAGPEVEVYRISGIDEDGFLEKERWLLERPRGVVDLVVLEVGNVAYLMDNGEVREIEAPSGSDR